MAVEIPRSHGTRMQILDEFFEGKGRHPLNLVRSIVVAKVGTAREVERVYHEACYEPLDQTDLLQALKIDPETLEIQK